MWFLIGVVIGLFILSALLAPKPKLENAKAATLDQFKFPTAKEGTPAPLIYGRIRQQAPNVLWHGMLRAVPIREKVKTGLFSSKRVIVGYKYYLTMDLSVCLLTGVSVSLNRVWFGDKLVWERVAEDTSNEILLTVSGKENILGGHKNGGGFGGKFRWYPGKFNQTVNTRIEDRIAETIPAYRGMAHAVFENFFVGETPNLLPASFEVQATPNALGLGTVGAEGDANPAEVLYDLLTNRWGRAGLSTTLIDTASFVAAGNTLNSEGHGISIAFQSTTDVKSAIEEILKQIDAVLYEEPTTRQIRLKLIRNDYSVPDLSVFDESNILEMVDYSTNSWEDTLNQVRIVYNSRAALYKEKTAFVQDLANITFQGRIRSSEFTFLGVCTEALANRVASRELNYLSIPLVRMRIVANREASVLRPGDVIKISWPEYGLSQLICRVQKFDLGELDDGRIAIDLIQDRFGTSSTIFADPPPSDWNDPTQPPAPITTSRIVELPRWFGIKIVDAGQDVGGTINSSYIGYFASPPDSELELFDAIVDDDADEIFSSDQADAAYSVTALVHTQYALTTNEFDTTVGLRIKSISDPDIFAAATDAEVAQDGSNLFMIGDEIMAYQSFVDNEDGTYTLNNIWRGILDTSPRTHAVDARVFFFDKGLEVFGTTPFDGTEDLDIKLLSKTAFFVLPETDAPTIDLQLQQRPIRPYSPDLVTLDSVAHPATLDNATPVTVAWTRRDRLAANITKPNAADETPEAGTTYLARWQVGANPVRTQSLGSTSPAVLTFDNTETGATTLNIHAVKDGLESLYPVIRTFIMTGNQFLQGAASVTVNATGQLTAQAASNLLQGTTNVSVNATGLIILPVGFAMSSPSLNASPIVSPDANYTSWASQALTSATDIRNNEPAVGSPSPASWTIGTAANQAANRASAASITITSASNPPPVRFRNFPSARVPGNAIITGFEVLVRFGQNSPVSWLDNEVRLAWDPTTSSGGNVQTSPQNKGLNTNCTVWGSKTYGSQNDLWGTSLTPSLVNSPEFGIIFKATSVDAGSNVQEIDSVQIRVHYSISTGAGEARITNYFVEAITENDAPVRVGTVFAEVSFDA